jgi:hypothetical protein
MTPRTLFITILRVLGIILILLGLIQIPQLFMLSTELFTLGLSGQIASIALTVATTLIYIFAISLLLKNPEIIINKLSLDQGFEEQRIELKIHSSTVIRITVLLFGLSVFIDHIVVFLIDLFTYLSRSMREEFYLFDSTTSSKRQFIQTCLMLVLSLLCIRYSKEITIWIEKKRRAN